ncbi:hypothetical protein PVAP13_3NG246800 [Panicum virgatum]|uniref:Ubiquitin-like protease family profile domain-containing protein n=1 Tax=Panicum virgatum TaxID=38727 RepID=A0A8T0UKB1_PANVG|nr:hypothetical protein PVAP13_3NG246800 [Panicum virgatum]
MYQEARVYDAPIGFLDPCTIFQTYLRPKPKAVEKYLADVMYRCQKKSHILGAYNFNDHWILVVLRPLDGYMIVLDSLDYNQDELTTDMLGKVGCMTNKRKKCRTLPCHKQPPHTVVCGYYVCHYMRKFVEDPAFESKCETRPNRSALAQSELTKIRGEMCYFLMSQVIKETGEFYDPC